MSLPDVQELLLLGHLDGLIDYEEFCLLFDLHRCGPVFNHNQYQRFVLQEFSDEECWTSFRFGKLDIAYVANVLRLPDKFRCSNRTSAGKEEAFCMLLRRLAYPCRYVDLMPQFGRSLPEISLITNAVTDYIYDTHGHLLTTLNHPWMASVNLKEMADAVHAKGAPLQNCWGFVDGTV